MIIKAIKFRKDGCYGQPFAFGGEDNKNEEKLAAIKEFANNL